MTHKKNLDKTHKKLFNVLCMFAVMINIKGILTDYNVDSGYAIATSYRQLLGDKMISDMWEPHQTSAFLCTFLMWLYTMITHTTTGVVLFLHATGVVIKGALTIFVHHSLRSFIHPVALDFMCLYMFVATPKGLVLPEFSNMQLWFSICLFCCLVKYFQFDQKLRYLFAAGFFLCLEVLAYPACILVAPGCVFLLFLYSSNKWRDSLLLMGECLIIGGVYIGYFVIRMGFDNFLMNCRYIITGDSAHNKSILSKLPSYFSELVNCLLIYIILFFIAVCIAKIFSRKISTIAIILFLLCDFFKTLTSTTGYFERFPIYFPVIIFSMLLLRYCNNTEKQIYIIGTVISILSFISTLTLTNLTLLSSSCYLVLGIMVAFIPFTYHVEKQEMPSSTIITYGFLTLFLLTTFFHYGFITKCMGGQKTNLFHIGGVVKSGPALGIFSEYMGPFIMNITTQEWKQYIQPGDKVLIVSVETLDSLMYLYQADVIISSDSTMCNPTYNDKLLSYWEYHPEKFPNVVLIESRDNTLLVSEDTWIMKWLYKEFDSENYIDGKYWRYYRK